MFHPHDLLLLCYHIFFLSCLLKDSNASKLELFDSNSTTIKTIHINTPGFTLGNLNFPISGIPVVGVGCDGISEIENKKIIDPSLKYIALIEFGDGGCFLMSIIFECQKRNWCIGVLFQDTFFDPTGLNMRIQFDKHRNRKEYKVPAVQASMNDFKEFNHLILETNKNDNGTYMIITLTNDPNPWTEMFESIAFLIIFRILSIIWSFGCLIFITKILWNQYKQSLSLLNNQLADSQLTKKCSCKKLTLKQVCLLLHWITHISRIVFFIDPFAGQQIYTYPFFIILQSAILVFEIASNILLSFVIRELTDSNQTNRFNKRVKFGYMFSLAFIILSFFASAFEAFQISRANVQTFVILAIFFIVANIGLGVLYFWQGYRFNRKCAALEKTLKKQNRKKIMLMQISMFNSICMILFGGLIILISLKEVYGKPWGFFFINISLVLVIQISSLFEVLLFGGIIIDFKKVQKAILNSLGTDELSIQ